VHYFFVIYRRAVGDRLSETAGLTLRLHEAENVVLADGALDISDNASAGIVEELNANLGDATSGTCSAQDLDDSGKLNGSLGILVVSI
jgi:hypothetical protein